MDYVTLNIAQETLEKMEVFYKEDLVFNVGESRISTLTL